MGGSGSTIAIEGAGVSAAEREYAVGLQMVTVGEIAGPLFRLAMLVFTATTYSNEPRLMWFVAFLAVVNIGEAIAMARGWQLLTRGRRGIAIEVAHVAAAIVLAGVVLPRGHYLGPSGVLPLGSYASSAIALLVAYPSRDPSWRRMRPKLDFAATVLFTGSAYLLAAMANGTPLSSGVWKGVLALEFSSLAGFALGLAVSRFCSEVVRRQLTDQSLVYEGFFNFLHSDLKSRVGAISLELEMGNSKRAIDLAAETRRRIAAIRVELLLEQERPSLATLVAERIRVVDGLVDVVDPPKLGMQTLPTATARAVDRVLGDLLSNAVQVRARRVRIGLGRSDGALSVSVQDDGPGLPADSLTQAGSSLDRLRQDLERAGGGLTASHDPDWSTTVTAVVPLTDVAVVGRSTP